MATKHKSAAIVTIKDAAKMTPKGRKQVATWLRQHATDLVEGGARYAPRFTGRYLYEPRMPRKR